MSRYELAHRGEAATLVGLSGEVRDRRLTLAAAERQETEKKPILNEWKEKGFAEVPVAVNREQVDGMVDSFRDFCSLPDETKQSLVIQGDQGRGKGSVGYVERTPKNDAKEVELGKVPEHKIYFHYHPRLETELAEQIKNAGPKAQEFLRQAREIWYTMASAAKQFVQRLEHENPVKYAGVTEKFFPTGQDPKLILRVLLYKKVADGAMSANNHYDAGGITFAIAESGPGLQVGTEAEKGIDGTVTKQEEMRDVERPYGVVLAWPGYNFKQIDAGVQPTWHGVKQKVTETKESGETRYAVVAFLDSTDEEAPSLEETHGVRKS